MDWAFFAFWCLLHLECFFCFLFRDCGPRGEEGVGKGVFIDGKWEMGNGKWEMGNGKAMSIVIVRASRRHSLILVQ
jgi:hypothetical protein